MMRRLFLIFTVLFWLAVIAAMLLGYLHPAEKAGAGVAERSFSLDEVARHADESDCWMVINGKVYELSTYLPDHPSRPSIILPWCGKEASEAYRTKMKERPHSPQADRLLEIYYIGPLRP